MQQTALITGASSGIGRALAYEHAAKGRDLVIVARREPELRQLSLELQDAYGINVLVMVKDLTLPGSCQEIYEQLKALKVEVEILINNAGFGGFGQFVERELALELNMIDLNVKALVALTHLFLEDMIKRGSGKILNVSSTAGFTPGPLQAVYFATKAFVNSFTWALAHEVRASGVTLTTLNPGPVDTEFAKVADGVDTLLMRHSDPIEPTARQGYRAMEKGQRKVIPHLALRSLITIVQPFFPLRWQLHLVEWLQQRR